MWMIQSFDKRTISSSSKGGERDGERARVGVVCGLECTEGWLVEMIFGTRQKNLGVLFVINSVAVCSLSLVQYGMMSSLALSLSCC